MAITGVPHPEEPKNPSATMLNVDLVSVIKDWIEQWSVGTTGWPVELSKDYLYPGVYVGGVVKIRPEWCNPGVIAHECAHVVWSRLTDDQRDEFGMDYLAALKNDELVQKPYKKCAYMRTNDMEAHAELYRYLGKEMPEELHKYYLGLIGESIVTKEKKWYTSKTLWANVIYIAGFVLTTVYGVDISEEEQAVLGTAGLAVVNIVLRALTNSKLTT